MQTARKKRIIVIAAAAVLAVIMMTFGTVLAWLTKPTEYRANNFTFGSIDVDLEEEDWDKEDHTVYPGRVVAKDPVVVNQGKNALYAYLEVWVPYRYVSYVAQGHDGEADAIEGPYWMELVKWDESGLDDGWKLIKEVGEVTDAEDDSIRYMVYRFVYTELVPPKSSEPDNKTAKLFEKVTFLETILEGEPEKETVFEMPIYAYAIQSEFVDEADGDTLEERLENAFNAYLAQMSNSTEDDASDNP